MSNSAELIALSQHLLESIVTGDWKTYAELCHPQLTCFEPEAHGHLVEGMAFHKFYFDLGAGSSPCNVTMSSPTVKFCGDDVAIVAYVRITQKLGGDGNPISVVIEETRIWQREGQRWRHVHFHRSAPG